MHKNIGEYKVKVQVYDDNMKMQCGIYYFYIFVAPLSLETLSANESMVIKDDVSPTLKAKIRKITDTGLMTVSFSDSIIPPLL